MYPACIRVRESVTSQGDPNPHPLHNHTENQENDGQTRSLAHKRKPDKALRKATVRQAPVLGQGSAGARGGGGVVVRSVR